MHVREIGRNRRAPKVRHDLAEIVAKAALLLRSMRANVHRAEVVISAVRRRHVGIVRRARPEEAARGRRPGGSADEGPQQDGPRRED